MAMIAPNHGLTGKQLAALNLLAASRRWLPSRKFFWQGKRHGN